jgi:NADH-quinone oxidoreductase subunit L
MLLLVWVGSGAAARAPGAAPAPAAVAGANSATTLPLLTFRELRAELTRGMPAAAPAAASPAQAGAPTTALGRAQLFGVPVILLVGLALFLAMAGKSAQLPLHVWLPDAMAGPTPVSALIHAATMVTAGVYLAARLSFLLVHSPEAMAVIAAAGVVTAFLGAAMALVQQDIKKVLAYSTISQLGFMFLSVGVGAFGPALFHLVTHAGFKACLFLAAGSVIHALHEAMEHASPGLVPADRRLSADPADPQDLRNMGGLISSLPRTRLAYLLGAVAIAGFPLASGFYSKDEILWRVFTSSTLVPGALLYTLAVLSAGLTAFYVFRSYYLAFRGRVSPDAAPGAQLLRESPRSMIVPLYLLAGASLLLGPTLGWPHAWGGNPVLEGFLRPLFVEADAFGRARPMPVWTPFLLQALGLAMTGAGWLLARRMYRDLARGQAMRGQLRRRLDGLHRLLWNRLHVDDLYRWLFVLPAEDFARGAWFADRRLVDGAVTALARAARALSRLGGAIDARVVDGVVNGVSELTLAGGRRLARLQTGRINHYVLGIALGAGALVAITWVIK